MAVFVICSTGGVAEVVMNSAVCEYGFHFDCKSFLGLMIAGFLRSSFAVRLALFPIANGACRMMPLL